MVKLLEYTRFQKNLVYLLKIMVYGLDTYQEVEHITCTESTETQVYQELFNKCIKKWHQDTELDFQQFM